MDTPNSYFVLNIIYILLSFLYHFSYEYHCNRVAMWNKKDTQKVKDTKTNSSGNNQCRIYYLRYLQIRHFMEISIPTYLNMHQMLK